MVSVPKFELSVLGALTLVNPSGEDVTPRLEKSKGLLAYLAVADGRPVSRSVLQALLWSDRSEKQSRESLKKAVNEVRSSLQRAPSKALTSSQGYLKLDLTHIKVDLLNSGCRDDDLYAPVFLEGIKIIDEGFDEWVGTIRRKLAAAHPEKAGAVAKAAEPMTTDSGRQRVGIGFLSADAPASPMSSWTGDYIAQSLQSLFLRSGLFRVYDFTAYQTTHEVIDRRPDLFIQVDAIQVGEEVCIQTGLFDVTGSRLIWRDTTRDQLQNVNFETMQTHAAQVFDIICEKAFSGSALDSKDHIAARHVFSAIDHIFRLSTCDLEAAEAALDCAHDIKQSATTHAWQAFLSAFQVEKSGRLNVPEIIDRAKFHSSQALSLDRHNPLVLALIAHVQSFVLRDKHSAFELLNGADAKGPVNPMMSDTLAMLNFYEGRFDDAAKHARAACTLGTNNPFRYSFTTSLAMCQMMLEDYTGAAKTAERALAQHPFAIGYQYEPTLRTLATAFSLSGQKEEGRAVLKRLDAQSGEDTIERLRSGPDVPFPNMDVLRVVRNGLEGLNA